MFKPEEGKIDKRHGDPEAGGKTSGQKVGTEELVLCYLRGHVLILAHADRLVV